MKTPTPPPPSPDAILSLRRTRGLSQADAAAAIYRTERSWCSWESGAKPMPPELWELARFKLTH